MSQDRSGPLAVVCALTLVVALAAVAFPDNVPTGIVLRGALFGAATGLLAVGLVLTYRTSRIINFSYGAMGSVGGGLAAALTVGKGWHWGQAAVIGVVTGVVAGALVERIVVRRFAHAPRLVLTVATIGLAQLLGGLAVYIPTWLGTPAIIPRVATPLSSRRLDVDPVTFTGDDLLVLGMVPVVVLGLTLFLMRSDAGMAVRGMADNIDRARLLGIPVNSLSLLVWSVAGGLAALAVVLRAPSEGVPLSAASGPILLLPALAAAVVAGMRSMTGAFVAAVFLGVVDQLVLWNADANAPTPVVMLAVIVVALLVHRRSHHRADDAEASWSVVGTGHGLARAYAALPEVRAAKVATAALVAVGLVVLPVAGTDAQINFGTVTLTYALVALSLVVLTGWGGVVSLGQVAVMGVGGVITANLVADHNVDVFVGLGLSALVGGLVALLLGLPALRVSGELLAVTTLAFAVAMELYVLNPANYERHLPAAFGRPALWGVIELADERWLYGFALVLLAAGVYVVRNLRAARAGRSISATRDNARSASAAGISTVEARLAAFVFAGALAGLAGGVHAVALRGIGQSTYPAATSLLVFSMAVIGGVTSIPGTLVGVALVQWAGYMFPRAQLLITGISLVAVLVVLPGGIAQAYEHARDRVVRAIARRHGLADHVAVETVEQAIDPARTGLIHRDAAGAGMRLGSVRRARKGANLLTCHGIEASYGSTQVLFGIDLKVERNELMALLGTNGSGKSTLLRSVAGLVPPTGRVVFDGQDIAGLPAEEIARLGLSLMPGGQGVFPTLTVAENLRLACWMARHERSEAADLRSEAITMFPVLGLRDDQLAGDLSGGEQQQLSLAMAFMSRPKLMLIDELSLGLAPSVVDRLVDKVREIHAHGTTVVVVEQSVNVALLLCHRTVFLERGEVRFRGPTAGLLDRPDILRAVFIGGEHTISGRLPALPAHAAAPPPWERPTRGVTLEARGLDKRFGGIRALDGIHIVIHPSTIVGLIGHNGAGKTTLFDVLTGFLPADGGQVLLNGVDITDWPPHKRAIGKVGRTFQEARLYPSLSVEDAIAVALEQHLANRDPLAAALRLPAAVDSEASAAARVDYLIELLGLGAHAERPTGELSAGMRRIVELACLLAQDPAVVLLDEPSAGVGQREAEALGPLLRRVQGDTGCSMVIIEHDMGLLSSLCDGFVALEQGAVIAGGTPQQVLSDRRVISSYLGTNEAVVHRSGSLVGSSYSSGYEIYW